MKIQELRQLIREEIQHIVNENDAPVWRHGETVEVGDEGYLDQITRPRFIEVYKVTPTHVYYIDDAGDGKFQRKKEKFAINATFQRNPKNKSKKPQGKLD